MPGCRAGDAISGAASVPNIQQKIEIDEEAFNRLHGFRSHPIKVKEDQRIAVRVVSQFGEESMKVLEV